MYDIFRPWGEMEWIVKKLNPYIDWMFIGSISPEDRAITAYNFLNKIGINITYSHFIIIKDKPSRHTPTCNNKIKENRKKLFKYNEETEFHLLYEQDNILVNFADQLTELNKNIIFDISCFPKRFFFPLLRRFIASDKNCNLIVTNTLPFQYEHSQPLSESYGNWRTIPLFQDLSEDETKELILFSVGHLPMGAPEPIYDICNSKKIVLYFPFPGHPHSLGPIWRFIHDIEKIVEKRSALEIECISSRDTSEIFDSMKRATDDGQKNAILAPYGPKPFSLAMALFASKYNQPVYYTQPRVYHPGYSKGVQMRGSRPVITAYVIKNNGFNYY